MKLRVSEVQLVIKFLHQYFLPWRGTNLDHNSFFVPYGEFRLISRYAVLADEYTFRRVDSFHQNLAST